MVPSDPAALSKSSCCLNSHAEPGSELQLVTRRDKDLHLGPSKLLQLKNAYHRYFKKLHSLLSDPSVIPQIKSIKISLLLIPCWVEACRCSMTKM